MASELWAEFAEPARLESAAHALRAQGARDLDALVPFEWPELAPALGLKPAQLIPRAVLTAAVLGALLAFLIIWWTAARSYPLNVGGRPLSSLPTDVPIVFETSVLFAAVTAFVLAVGLAGMPRLEPKRATLPGFERVAHDRFWLGVLDPVADYAELARALSVAGALRVVRLDSEGAP